MAGNILEKYKNSKWNSIYKDGYDIAWKMINIVQLMLFSDGHLQERER